MAIGRVKGGVFGPEMIKSEPCRVQVTEVAQLAGHSVTSRITGKSSSGSDTKSVKGGWLVDVENGLGLGCIRLKVLIGGKLVSSEEEGWLLEARIRSPERWKLPNSGMMGPYLDRSTIW